MPGHHRGAGSCSGCSLLYFPFSSYGLGTLHPRGKRRKGAGVQISSALAIVTIWGAKQQIYLFNKKINVK